MSIFSRRKTDPRKAWDDNAAQADDGLTIPPCAMQGDTNTPESFNEANMEKADIEKTKVEKTNDPLSQNIDENFRNALTPQCWAFMGTVGGVGTTALAVQMAYELTKLQKSSMRA